MSTRENIRLIARAPLCSSPRFVQTMPGGYKTYFMLNSTQHEFSTLHKIQIAENLMIFLLSNSQML